MESVVEFAPGHSAPALRPFVDGYSGYRQEGNAPRLHRGMPSSTMTFVLSMADPVELTAMPDPTQSPSSFTAMVCGLHDRPAGILHDGHQYGVQLDLDPLMARSLFGMPASAIGATVIDLRDLWGPVADEVVDRLHAAADWGARFAVLDDVLGRVVDPVPVPSPEVVWAWRRLVRSGGRVPVGALADEVGWSRRHFAQRFREELGLPPKVAARVVRFERSTRLVRDHGRTVSLATVAAECGYFDQAHLTRDWNEFAGCPPTTWIDEELPSVQDETLSGSRS